MALYETYYGCEREPFSLSPDPEFLFAAAPHREALAQLRYLIQERKGFAVITGEVGTGKTMLLRTVIEAAGPNVQTGYVFNPPRTREALYEAIADELGLHFDDNANPAMELNRYFLSTYRAGRTVVMIFDEAQALPIDVLEEIRLLTNIETPRAKLVQVILAGQAELDALIDSTELRALRQRLVFRYSLGALGRPDAVGYIAARIAAAGAKNSPFTQAACNAVHRYSGGIPRLINVICDNAMLSGYATDSRTIDEEVIDEVALDLKLAGPSRRRIEMRRPLSAAKPALAEAQPSSVHSRTILLEPGSAVEETVQAQNLAPRIRAELQEPSLAIDLATNPRSLTKRRRLESSEWLSTLDEASAAARSPQLGASVRVPPVLSVVTGQPLSRRLRYMAGLSILLLIVALAIGTIAVRNMAPKDLSSAVTQFKALRTHNILRLNQIGHSFAQGVDLSVLWDRARQGVQ